MLDWYKPTLIRSLRSGYSAKTAMQDISAGLVVGIIALPLSMGLAIASGCKPEQGLFTAIIGATIVSTFGGSRVQIAGPAGAFVGLCASGISQYGYSGLALATLMAGVLMFVMGFLRLGKAITFIPIPVVIGFTTGIAVILASTQVSPLLGISEPAIPMSHFHQRIGYVVAHIHEAKLTAVFLGLATVAIIVLLHRWRSKIPGALIALVVVGSFCYAMKLDVPTIHSRFGDIPRTIPLPSWNAFGFDSTWNFTAFLERTQQLSGLALAIALLSSIESLLSAVVADGMAHDRHDSNSELVGQGLANIASPFFLGMPVSGVIARTSTNIRAGAQTPIAGLVHALTVLAIIMVAAPIAVHVPLACLAGVLLVVCWYMAELRHWPHILKAGRSDAFLLPLAFGLTVLVDLTWAVVVGVLLAMFFFVKRMAEATQIERHVPDTKTGQALPMLPGVQIYDVNGPFFFGAATLIRDLDNVFTEKQSALILRISHVPFIDATAAFALRELIASCAKRHVRFILADVTANAHADLRRHGIVHLIGETNIHDSLASALSAIASAVVVQQT